MSASEAGIVALVTSLRSWKVRWRRADGDDVFIVAGASGSVVLRRGMIELCDPNGNRVGESYSSTDVRALHDEVVASFRDRDALAMALRADLEPF